jgi:hypothetical protein
MSRSLLPSCSFRAAGSKAQAPRFDLALWAEAASIVGFDSATRLTVSSLSIPTCLSLDLVCSNVPLVVSLFPPHPKPPIYRPPSLTSLLQIIQFPRAPYTRPLRPRYHGQCGPCSEIFGRHRALPWPSTHERGGAKVKRGIAKA